MVYVMVDLGLMSQIKGVFSSVAKANLALSHQCGLTLKFEKIEPGEKVSSIFGRNEDAWITFKDGVDAFKCYIPMSDGDRNAFLLYPFEMDKILLRGQSC